MCVCVRACACACMQLDYNVVTVCDIRQKGEGVFLSRRHLSAASCWFFMLKTFNLEAFYKLTASQFYVRLLKNLVTVI